jgi:hypothetical protein
VPPDLLVTDHGWKEYVYRPQFDDPRWANNSTEPNVKGFEYRIVVRNTGAKTIKVVEWDYIFLDPETAKELSRHRFRSRVTIKPGKSARLAEFSATPPTRAISARALGESVRGDFGERVAFSRIEYADKRAWRARPRQTGARDAESRPEQR